MPRTLPWIVQPDPPQSSEAGSKDAEAEAEAKPQTLGSGVRGGQKAASRKKDDDRPAGSTNVGQRGTPAAKKRKAQSNANRDGEGASREPKKRKTKATDREKRKAQAGPDGGEGAELREPKKRQTKAAASKRRKPEEY